jgi:hypothetical protein
MAALLARLAQKQLLGTVLPDGLRVAARSEFEHLLPYSEPIMATRGRSTEDRQLELDAGVRH